MSRAVSRKLRFPDGGSCGEVEGDEEGGEVVEGCAETFMVCVACDVWTTQMGLLKIVVAEPAMSPANIDSSVLKPLPLPLEAMMPLVRS